MKQLISLILVLILNLSLTRAQGLIVTPSFQYGTMIKTDEVFPALNHTPYIAGLNISGSTSGKAPWQHLYHFPQLGMAAYYISTGNSRVLGKGIALAPSLVFRLNKRHKLPIQLGLYTGYAYLTKSYDANKNPENNVIGTRFNFFDQACLMINPRISKQLKLQVGLSISHLSNGRIKDPDLGINIPSVFLAIEFNRGPDSFPKMQKDIVKLNRKVFGSARIGLGAHDYLVRGGPLYSVYTASLFINYRFNPVFKLGLGAHVNYNASAYYFTHLQQIYAREKAQELAGRVACPVVNAEWFIGRLALNVDAGVYLNHPYLTEGIGYAKYGFMYYFQKTYQTLHNRVGIGMMVQATTGRAEFPEICLGYYF